MKSLILVMFLMAAASGCAYRIDSVKAEKVILYEEQDSVPAQCKPLGDVMAIACSIESIFPDEVMKMNLRENAYDDFSADAVLLQYVTVSGTDVMGFGIAYECN